MRIGKREIATIVLCLTIIGASVSVTVLPMLDSIQFETVDQGIHCGITARVQYVITDSETWAQLWTDIHSIRSHLPNLPLINFTSDTLIAVFMGEKYIGGYSTEIMRITSSWNAYTVYVTDYHPNPESLELNWFVQPYHIVRIPSQGNLSLHFVNQTMITPM